MFRTVIFLAVANLADAYERPLCDVDGAAAKSLNDSSLLQVSTRTRRYVDAGVNGSAGWNNLCINETLAPEFLLLGCEKCATSSFSVMFNTEGVVYPNVNGSNGKQTHVFDRPDFYSYPTGFWLQHYPKCIRSKRMVATDFTPCYLNNEEAPLRIHTHYGKESSNVKFAVVLRNPVDRMHSAFHFWKRGIGRPLCSNEQIGVTFEVYVRGVLAGSDPCGIVAVGDYATQLQGYFNVFSPSQFTIILFRQITAPQGNAALVISDLWQRLGLTGGPPPQVVRYNSQQNNKRDGPHPTLEQDLDVSTLQALKAYMESKVGSVRLAGVLTAVQQKPILARYSGPGDQASVATWIQENW